MSEKPSPARQAFGELRRTRRLYGRRYVWKGPVSPRDRSLITVASLVSLYRMNELPFHLKKALENGVTRNDLIELITHLGF